MPNAPIVRAIEEYLAKDRLRQHMPGHKGQKQAMGLLAHWGDLAAWDLTEADGLDDLHSPTGAIRQAEKLMAAATDAKRAYLLVNGASAGILAAILAATAASPDSSLILPRNAHRSVWHALTLAGCRPIWLAPPPSRPHQPPLGITPQQLQNACQADVNCRAALFVYPSYYGVCPDLPSMLAVCRQNNLISIVDEAHGAHLPFISPTKGAARLGADLVIDSWHKSMGSLGQSAVLLNNLPPERLQPERWLTLLQTTSPSYPLLASLDAARAEWCEQTAERAAALQQEREAIAQTLQQTTILRLYNAEDLPGGFSYDYTKALLYSAAGHNGWQLATALRQAGIEPELTDADWALLLLSYADGLQPAGIAGLLTALRQTDEFLQATPPQPVAAADLNLTLPKQIMLPAEAMRRPSRLLPLKQAAGRTAAGLLTPYPPGIPWLGPGELIEKEHLEAAEILLQAGGRLQGLNNGLIPVTA